MSYPDLVLIVNPDARSPPNFSWLSSAQNHSALVSPVKYHHHRITTTVSRLFTDKAGAGPQDSTPGESTNTTPPKRPSILQRLHIHTSGRKNKATPNLTIRPTSSSSLPPLSTTVSRTGSSHSDAVTIAEITDIMPQSLTLTPPQGAVKRQRSQELPSNPSGPTSTSS